MNIVGLLSWWDESPSWLSTSVAGFARFCSHVVAVDGAYQAFPGGRARSRPDQAEAVMHACEAAGIGCTVHRPSDVFAGNEVEKRNLTLRLASPFLTEHEDWVVVFDADCHVAQAYPEIIRRDLAETDCDVATYTILDGQDLLADPDTAEMARALPASTEWTARSRLIYRWLPGLRYGPTHYCVRAYAADGSELWLRGAKRESILPQMDLGKALVVHHRRQHRAQVRFQTAEEYGRLRSVLQLEPIDDCEMLVQ